MPEKLSRLGEINVPLAIAWMAVAVLGVQAVFPPLRAFVNSYVLTIAMYAVAFVAILALYKADQITVDLVLVSSLFALVFIAFSTMLTGNTVLFNRYFNLICLIAGYPLFRLVVERLDKKGKYALAIVIIGFATLTCIRTCTALVQNPYIARSIKSEGEYTAGLLSMGIGGYEIVYFAVICSTIMLWDALNATNRMRKVISFLLFAIMVCLILYANYMTALIAALIGAAIVLLMKIGKASPAAAVSAAVMTTIVLAVLIAAQDQLLQVITNMSGDGRVSRVLNSSDSLLTGITDEFLSDRAPVMQKSINEFGLHLFIGLNGMTSSIGASGAIASAGQHSFVLDTLAYFGLIGGPIILLAVFMPFWSMGKHGVDRRLTTPLLVVFVILLIFNNATSSIAIAALLLPLLLSGVEDE